MDLCSVCCLLGHLILPLSHEQPLIGLSILAVELHACGLCWLLVVPCPVTFGGLVPPDATVSLAQCVAAGVAIQCTFL